MGREREGEGERERERERRKKYIYLPLILSVQCLCSGGCPDYLEECKSCEPGYQGSYCQEGS